MKEKELLRQNSNWIVETRTERNSKIALKIQDSLSKIEESKYELIEALQEIENESAIINDRERENIAKYFVEIIDYKEGEFVSFSTELFPTNYYKMESYRNHTLCKNTIMFSVADKLNQINLKEDGTFENNWEKAIVIFQLQKEGRKADLDNYFCKPFVDGIVYSKFIKNDFAENISLIYANLKGEKQMVKVTIINKEHIGKYVDFIVQNI